MLLTRLIKFGVLARLVISTCTAAASDDDVAFLRGANNTIVDGAFDDGLFEVEVVDGDFSNSSFLELSSFENEEGRRELFVKNAASISLNSFAAEFGAGVAEGGVDLLFGAIKSEINRVNINNQYNGFLQDVVDKTCNQIRWNQLMVDLGISCDGWHIFAHVQKRGWLRKPWHDPKSGFYWREEPLANNVRLNIFNSPAVLQGPADYWKYAHLGFNRDGFAYNSDMSRGWRMFYFGMPPAIKKAYPRAEGIRWFSLLHCRNSNFNNCYIRFNAVYRNRGTCVNLERSDTSSALWSTFPYMQEVCFHKDDNCHGARKCWKVGDNPPRDFSQDRFNDGSGMNDNVRSVQYWHETQ